MTNDERREVARKLRENAEAHPDMSLVLNVAFADEGLRPEGMKEWKVTSHDAAMRLADLIDPGEDTTVSAYDLLSKEEREALRWVHGHGGLDEVRRDFQDAYNRHVELCAALGIDMNTGWSDAMAEIMKRLMPEGMEWLLEAWPRFDDGEPVKFGDMALIDGEADMVEAVQLWIHGKPVIYGDGGSQQLDKGECVNRPATKVPDAGGEEIELGDDLYSVEGGLKFHVSHIDIVNGKIATDAMFALDKWADPKNFTHRAPVLAADGKPLEAGQTVWDEHGDELRVLSIVDDHESHVMCHYEGTGGTEANGWWLPHTLTHQRPVFDADGVEIREGDTVYLLPGKWCGEYPLRYYNGGDEMVVKELDPDHELVGVLKCVGDGKCTCFPLPRQLTHTKPEIDTWERIEEDLGDEMAKQQCGPISPELACKLAGEYVRRCRALAGVSE